MQLNVMNKNLNTVPLYDFIKLSGRIPGSGSFMTSFVARTHSNVGNVVIVICFAFVLIWFFGEA